MRPGVDVLVVSYRTPEYLSRFLDSYDANKTDSDLFVTIHEPHHRDQEVAKKVDGVVLFDENTGYATPVNHMATMGDREVIAIFNADVDPLAAIEPCARALMEHDDWGILGPRQVSSMGKMTHAGIFGSKKDPQFRGWQKADRPEYADIQEAVTVSGSAFFIKRAIWEELTRCPTYQEFCQNEGLNAEGAFLPTFMYYEETFCSRHCDSHGYKVMYYGVEKMIHEWDASPKTHKTETARGARELYRRACNWHGIPHEVK